MAGPEFESPIKATDLATLQEQLRTLDFADKEADKALRAGLDIGDTKERLRALRTQVMQIKSVYFPGK